MISKLLKADERTEKPAEKKKLSNENGRSRNTILNRTDMVLEIRIPMNSYPTKAEGVSKVRTMT